MQTNIQTYISTKYAHTHAHTRLHHLVNNNGSAPNFTPVMKAQPVVGFWVSQLRGRQHHDHALAHNRTKDKNKQQPRERDVALHTNHHVQFKEQTKMHSKNPTPAKMVQFKQCVSPTQPFPLKPQLKWLEVLCGNRDTCLLEIPADRCAVEQPSVGGVLKLSAVAYHARHTPC